MRFEIDVEAGKIQERKLQILGGRIIDVGDEAVGVLGFRSIVKAFEEAFQFAAAMPAHNGSRNLVANGVAKNRRMAGAGADLSPHHLFNGTSAPAIIKKGHRAFNRQPGHDPQPVLLRCVQQPARRRRVRANSVHPVGGHPSKIALHHLRLRELLALLIGAKGAVSDSADIQLLPAGENKFPPHAETSARRNSGWRGEPLAVVATKYRPYSRFGAMFIKRDGAAFQPHRVAWMVVNIHRLNQNVIPHTALFDFAFHLKKPSKRR